MFGRPSNPLPESVPRHCRAYQPASVVHDFGCRIAIACRCGEFGPSVEIVGKTRDAELEAIRLWTESLKKQGEQRVQP